jgi:hypothetical protein
VTLVKYMKETYTNHLTYKHIPFIPMRLDPVCYFIFLYNRILLLNHILMETPQFLRITSMLKRKSMSTTIRCITAFTDNRVESYFFSTSFYTTPFFFQTRLCRVRYRAFHNSIECVVIVRKNFSFHSSVWVDSFLSK